VLAIGLPLLVAALGVVLLALTARRLIFRKLVGKGIEVPWRSITEISKAKVISCR